jgi:hypothetical protein
MTSTRIRERIGIVGAKAHRGARKIPRNPSSTDNPSQGAAAHPPCHHLRPLHTLLARHEANIMFFFHRMEKTGAGRLWLPRRHLRHCRQLSTRGGNDSIRALEADGRAPGRASGRERRPGRGGATRRVVAPRRPGIADPCQLGARHRGKHKLASCCVGTKNALCRRAKAPEAR